MCHVDGVCNVGGVYVMLRVSVCVCHVEGVCVMFGVCVCVMLRE